MNVKFKLILILILLTTACKKPVLKEESVIQAKVSVDVTGITRGVVKDELTLFATTMYLKRNVVASPIPGFITQVHVKLGESVKEDQLLFELETKEARALGSEAVMPDIPSSTFGKISVKAPTSGIVNVLDKQEIGDYVLEGSQLCVIAASNELAIAVNVPYEYKEFTKPGVKCTILLPDNTQHPATFTTPLTTMNSVDQTQTFLAKSQERLFLPENLIVKVLVNKGSDEQKQILPKAAVLSDEMMEKFWVMKLLNDSMAIKVDISPGIMNKESVEILEPQFQKSDKILVSGNYGLPDTAFVKVNSLIQE